MRYFLIDKVISLRIGKRARGIKNVSLSDDILHDHFPDHPIMPAALIVEASAQLAGFLLEATFNKGKSPIVRAILAQIQQAKFYRTCGPGDTMTITVTVDSIVGACAQVLAEVFVRRERVLRGTLTFVLRPIDSERLHEQRRSIYRVWTRDLKLRHKIR